MKFELKEAKIENGAIKISCDLVVSPSLEDLNEIEFKYADWKRSLVSLVEYKIREMWIEKNGEAMLEAIKADEIVKTVAQDLVKTLFKKDRY